MLAHYNNNHYWWTHLENTINGISRKARNCWGSTLLTTGSPGQGSWVRFSVIDYWQLKPGVLGSILSDWLLAAQARGPWFNPKPLLPFSLNLIHFYFLGDTKLYFTVTLTSVNLAWNPLSGCCVIMQLPMTYYPVHTLTHSKTAFSSLPPRPASFSGGSDLSAWCNVALTCNPRS